MKSGEPRLGLVLDRIEQFERSLVELVQGIDAPLAVDDLETFAAEPGSFLLDVVKIDEWNRIAAQDGVYEFLLLGSRPDNSTLILRIHDEHLLRLQVQHIAHLEILWLSLHRARSGLKFDIEAVSFGPFEIFRSKKALWIVSPSVSISCRNPRLPVRINPPKVAPPASTATKTLMSSTLIRSSNSVCPFSPISLRRQRDGTPSARENRPPDRPGCRS